MVIECVDRRRPAVGRHLHPHGCIEDGIPDRDRNPMFARGSVVGLRRTGTVDGDARTNRDPILVFGGRVVRQVLYQYVAFV